jgi:hypothetical protein
MVDGIHVRWIDVIKKTTTTISMTFLFCREKFGIHHVDFDSPTRERSPKASTEFIKRIIAQRLPKDAGDSASIQSSSFVIISTVFIIVKYLFE